MDNHLVNSITTILVAIIGVAILAVILAKQSNTAQVISSGGSAFSNILKSAVAPITGGAVGTVLGT
jgi:hypothetical protein